MNDTFAVYL